MRDLRLTGLDKGWNHSLRSGVNRAGRSPENELHLPEPSVSGFHCELHVSEQSILVKMAKTLGTGEIKLMDDRVSSQQAAASDEHCIGLYRVENGLVVAYAQNPNFQLFSEQGPLELVESIRKILYLETERTSEQTQKV